MAWSVNNLIEFVRMLTNKAQNGYITPTEFFYAWNSQQRLYHSDLLGRLQARGTGKTGANTGLLENETILTKLSPFTKPVTLPVIAGNATKPTDFIYGLAKRIDGEEVFDIQKGQIAFVNKSVIDPPSIADNKYFITEYLGYYTVFPSTVTSMDLDYICDCTDVEWGFILDGNQRPVYNPGTSSQPKWDNNSIMEITQRTLKPFGVHFSSQDFQNYGNSVIATGN